MFCCTVDDLDPNHDRIEYQDSPLKVRILEALGLKNFAINRFLFQRPVPSTSPSIQPIPSPRPRIKLKLSPMGPSSSLPSATDRAAMS